MRKTRLTTWLKALRGGKFTQTTGMLEYRAGDDTDNLGAEDRAIGHCCLGVFETLCEGKLDSLETRRRGGCSLPVVDHLKSLGLDENFQGKLAGFNDEGKSFAVIASAIERKIKSQEKKRARS